jgi:hypothetical protein
MVIGRFLVVATAGFETGDFTGWIVGGTTVQVGVAADGTPIANADPPFPPNFQNVRSGLYAGNALVRGDIPLGRENVVLSQTIVVQPDTDFQIGFWLGNDSASGFGTRTSNDALQIFIDGVGLLGRSRTFSVPPGSGPDDFLSFTGFFNSGSRTQVDVQFAIIGSGTSRVGVSFDDFFLVEGPAPEPTPGPPPPIPEPTTMLLLGTGLGFEGVRRMRLAKR